MLSNISNIQAKAPTTAKIVFASFRDGNGEIYIMNPDGSEQVNLTRDPAEDLFAVWSPDGKEILFASDRNGTRDLYLMDADGSNIRKVFKQTAYRRTPTWSPDGKQIAYERGIDAIYIATLGKQAEEYLVDGFDPAWSPDGTEIVFASGAFGSHRLTLINVRTGRQTKILPEAARAWQHWPAWSPTGKKIAFSWLNQVLPHGELFNLVDKETIYIVNRDGTGLKRVVPEAGPKATYPAWSPSGDELIYTQEINNQDQLFKIDLVNRASEQLTHIARGFLRSNEKGDWFDPVTLSVSPQPQLLTTTWAEVKQ
jgi:Tol biopolymer transport system component